MAPYRAGVLYFHGGASLQEVVVPVLTVRREPTTPPDVRQATVTLRYKNGATRITTRVPVIEVSVESGNLFSLWAQPSTSSLKRTTDEAMSWARPGPVIG